MNPLLAEQLEELGLDPDTPPRDQANWRALLDEVDRSYESADQGSGVGSVDEAARRKLHYDTLFARSPIATFEEDFSAVGDWLAGLRARGIVDLGAFLEANQAELEMGIAMVRIVHVNDSALAMLRVPSAATLEGRAPARSHTPDSLSSYVRQFEAIWADESYLSFEFDGRRADGAELHGILHWSAPRLGEHLDLSTVTVAIVDITERKNSERRMTMLVRSKDDFLASVSHELRTPLTAVYGSAEALLDQWDEIEPELQRELLGFIARESAELTQMVEDLLVAAQADIGRVSCVPLLTELRPLVDLVVEAVGGGRASGIRVEEVEGTAWIDPLRLKQIVRNLLTNAVRYGGDDIVVRASAEGARRVLTVTDDGEGVTEDRRDAIFDLYERGRPQEGLTGSVGIGLAVSRSLARLMGGDLVYEFVGGLSCFHIDMPASAPRWDGLSA